MKRIHEICIKNFKAFQQEEIFTIKGKNVLIYGNNGSGKSSLFWALYTFLQSSIKTDEQVQKYFKQFEESDASTHQSLKNIFMAEEEGAYIKLCVVDKSTEVSTTYTISHDVINTNNDTDTSIQELNLASDFINYNLLQNFYRASHKNEVNLWPVFERDIFPFLTDDLNKSYIEKIKEVTEDVPRGTQRVVRRGSLRYKQAIEKIDMVNEDISRLLLEIEQYANKFLKDHFFQENNVVKVKLEFTKKFKFNDIKRRMWDNGKSAIRNSKLCIKLVVRLYDKQKDGWMPPIHRIQSFLNEAQLTRIAIAIRIGALRTRVQGTDFKVLVLDDMLISLDMSNRMDVLRIILNQENHPDLEYFDTFQKIILTHDKGFYELIRRNTSDHEWEYYNFHTNENDNTAPRIKRDRTYLEKATAYLADGEYEACGIELRKETEAILSKYLKTLNSVTEGKFEPLSNKLNQALKKITETNRNDFKRLFINKDMDIKVIKKLSTDFETDDDLTPEQKGRLRGIKSELSRYFIKQYELKDDKARLIEEIQDVLKRVMNPAAHAGFSPLYEAELRKAIEGVKKLKEHLTE